MDKEKTGLEKYLCNEEREKFPEIMEYILQNIKTKKSLNTLSSLKEEIFVNKKFVYEKTDQGFFQNIKEKRGDCLDFSLLYHFLLNNLKIENNIVSAKGHTVIKFPFNQNLLETTEGVLKKPIEYIEKRDIPPLSMEKGIYLSPLNNKDVFALYLNKKSKKFLQEENYPKALEYLDRALSFSEKIPEIFYNKGIILNKNKVFEKSKKLFGRTLDLDPYFYEAMNNLGIACAQTGEEKAAEKYFRKVYKESKNPEKRRAKKNLEILKS